MSAIKRNALMSLVFIFISIVIAIVYFYPKSANVTLEDVATEMDGDGFTYSEYFKTVDELDQRTNGVYYKPIPVNEMMNVVPESIRNGVHLFDLAKLPFKTNEEIAYLVTSQNENGSLQHQVQFSYLNKSPNGYTEEFLIISVTELGENPLEKYDFSNGKFDSIGNELKREELIEGYPIYHQVITTNSALVYRYYFYDNKNNLVSLVHTQANELYTYYNGLVYHIGYSFNESKNNEELQENILQLIKEFILGNE